MENFKLDVAVNITVNLSEDTKAFISSFISEKIKSSVSSAPSQAQQKAEAPAAPKAPSLPQQKAAEPAAAPSSEENTKKVSIEDLRKALSEKVNDHRDAIKAKLTQLGAASITKLDPSKYTELYDFLVSL